MLSQELSVPYLIIPTWVASRCVNRPFSYLCLLGHKDVSESYDEISLLRKGMGEK